MLPQFPRTVVGGLSMPRMLIGSNWLLGYSHTGAAADKLIHMRNDDPSNMAAIIETFLAYGVDALMAPIASNPHLCRAIKMAEDKTGKHVIRIDTPGMNVDDNAEARREAEKVIKATAAEGCEFCLIHHASAEQLVNKNKQELTRLPDYLQMIRDNGMLPGLSAHMPELILYSDQNEYDVETYIQIYNCMGFMMQIEIEGVHKIIHRAKKPVMTIKPMAAGRTTPFVGITFSYSTLRPIDMVTVGCLTPYEALEDIEIGMAALEHRPPVLEGRNSPVLTSILK